MERNKKVSLVVVSMVLVSTFFTPTALAVRHKKYHEQVSATAEPDPDDHYLEAAAEPDPDHHDHIEVTSAAAELGPDDQISSGIVRRKVDVSVRVACNIMLAPCTSCKIGCICVPLNMLPIAGFCVGICCNLDPPPGPQPKPPSVTVSVAVTVTTDVLG